MKDLGKLHHFLGVAGLSSFTSDNVLDIMERAGMIDCKPCSTPVDT
jgi:hypothetical protein